MENSILTDLLKNKALDTYFSGRKYPPKYFEQFLPYKLSPTLQYNTILGSFGSPVMADVISYDSSAPEKKRKVVNKLSGDIPKISMKKKMSETQLNDFMQLRNLNLTDQDLLLDFVYDDVDACVEGCRARMEWLALQMLSYGKITLDKSNNAGIVTETEIDFLVPDANKVGASVIWSAAVNTTKPITDIDTINQAMIALGAPAKYILMDSTSFRYMRISTESSNFVFGRKAPSITKWANQRELNAELRLNNLPEIVLIDSRITIEDEAHTQTVAAPWTTGVIVGIPELHVGNMVHCVSAEETFPVKQCKYSKKDNILVSKFSETDPVTEWTLGQINSFPSWETAGECVMMYTLDTSWSI
jgi:hypothetical protein